MMAQNYHLIFREGFTHEVTWSKSFKVGGRQIPFCKYVFLGRTIEMLLGGGGGEQGRHVPTALKSSPRSGQNMAKSAQIELEFLKKCLEYRNSARTLPVVFNYFLADAHKYSQFS